MDESASLKKFGAQLQLFRLEKQWSQEKLALEAGVDRTYVSSVERGRRNISLLNILKFAAALEIPAFRLLENLQGEKIE